MDYITILKEDVDLTKPHQYLRLPHPRTGQAQLYLPYTSAGAERILEVIKVSCSHRRTWFVGNAKIESGTILLHVPVDPLFLVIPLLLPSLTQANSSSLPFQPLSDLIAGISSSSSFALPPPFTKDAPETGSGAWNPDVGVFLSRKSARRVLKLACERKVVARLPNTPDSQGESSSSAAGRESYYRPSMERIVQLLRLKTERLASEAEFEKFDHVVRGLGRDGLLEPTADRELVNLARLKASCDHIAQYIPSGALTALLASYNFEPLSTYLRNRTEATLAASVQLTSSKSDPTIKGTGTKRKAQPASRGVEALKKANTTGMAKLSNFFKSKEEKKA